MELTPEQQDIIEKIVVTMNVRGVNLTSVDDNPRPTKEDMTALLEGLSCFHCRGDDHDATTYDLWTIIHSSDSLYVIGTLSVTDI